MKYYTVYRNDTDEVVAFGTAKECADKRKMTVKSFHSVVSFGGFQSKPPTETKSKQHAELDLKNTTLQIRPLPHSTMSPS